MTSVRINFKKLIFKNLLSTTPKRELTQSRQIPSSLCTYCTHLASIFKDDMSPWVLPNIHIQRFYPPPLCRGDRLSEQESVESLLAFKSPSGLGHQPGGLGHQLGSVLGHQAGGGLGHHLAGQSGGMTAHSPGHILNWPDEHGPQVSTCKIKYMDMQG
jgi:hypothetical protein